MAFSATLVDRISFGNLQLKIYDLTDVQSGGSNLDTGFGNVRAVKAINKTDTSDTFKEAISSTVRGRVTFTAVNDNDDGHAWVWGN